MESTLSFRIVAAFVHALAWTLQWPMRLIYDLKQAERIGLDRPGLFERLLMKLFPYREITKDSGPQDWSDEGKSVWSLLREHKVLYLRRFFLTGKQWPIRIFLHHIAQSDDARAPHDHPWNFTTCPLRGAYSENIDLRPDQSGKPADVRFVQAGERYDNPAEHIHRVDLVAPMWTIVIAGPARREWGFVLPDGKHVPWRQYLNCPNEPDAPEDVIL